MDPETKKFLEGFEKRISARFDGVDARLDLAEADREVMWHAFLNPVEVDRDKTLAEAVVEQKRRGRRRRTRRSGKAAEPVALAARDC